MHLSGIDHAGHNNAKKNQTLYDISVGSIDNILKEVLEFVKKSNENYSVIIFGDHGSNNLGNHGSYVKERMKWSANTFYFTYSNHQDFFYQ